MSEVTKALTWDAPGTHWYETGVDHGVLYPMGKTGYEAGVAWNGLTSVSESPDGADANDLWADNVKYASLRAAENFKGTIEAYTWPEEWNECDGSAIVADGVTIGQQARKGFGLCYRTRVGNDQESAETYEKLHLVYGCTASPSDRQYETINDSPDGITFSWEFETTPASVTGHKPTALLVIDSRKADPTKLAALKEVLYGKGSTEPRLPTPDEVINMMKTA